MFCDFVDGGMVFYLASPRIYRHRHMVAVALDNTTSLVRAMLASKGGSQIHQIWLGHGLLHCGGKDCGLVADQSDP